MNGVISPNEWCYFLSVILLFLCSALPRYVRVNLIKKTVHEVVDFFIGQAWTLLPTPKEFDR